MDWFLFDRNLRHGRVKYTSAYIDLKLKMLTKKYYKLNIQGHTEANENLTSVEPR